MAQKSMIDPSVATQEDFLITLVTAVTRKPMPVKTPIDNILNLR
jgi:hypothetical protein